MNQPYIVKSTCRCCGSSDLLPYMDLGMQPLANSYHKGEGLPVSPLVVNLCQKCFHSQLSVVVSPASMFSNYLYVSGTTETFRKHCHSLADNVISCRANPPVGRPYRVLDVACNDGTLLESFRDLGCEVYGVDPAQNLRVLTEKKGIPVVVDFWGQHMLDKLTGTFDIITGTNVFAHVDDTLGFLQAAKQALSPRGTLVLEFPYCSEMIKHNEFDTVYHEHLSYFNVNSFTSLANRAGMRIYHVLQTPIHGGSIRFFLEEASGSHCKKVEDLIEQELNDGLLNVQSYLDFKSRVEENKRRFCSLMDVVPAGSVIGYGASAKGNTMLNYFGYHIPRVIDDNPMKHGFLTPGVSAEISGIDRLWNMPDLVYMPVLAWNFKKEIKKRVLEAKRPDQVVLMVYYVPDVTIEQV